MLINAVLKNENLDRNWENALATHKYEELKSRMYFGGK